MSGNTSLMSEMFGSSDSLQNFSSVLRHQVREDQQVLTCCAELLMEDGDVWKTRRTNVTLLVQCESLDVVMIHIQSGP